MADTEEPKEGLVDIIHDLMESMDWVGTGSQKSGDMERAKYEARIARALAATPSASPAGPEERGEGLREAYEGARLRSVVADIDARLAKLSVGNIGSKTRSREVERWAAAHLKGVRAVAVSGLVDALDDRAATPAPDTGAEERLRAALRAWLAATGGDDGTETDLVDAANEWLALSGGSVDEGRKDTSPGMITDATGYEAP